MRRLVVLLTFAGCGRLGFDPERDGSDAASDSLDAWAYRKQVSVDAARVPSTQDLVNFPLLVMTTDPDLRTVASGGTVHDPSGLDLVFAGDDGTTPLAFEIERYDGATGELIAWVKLPVLSPLTGARVYLYTGNASVTSSQQRRAEVWSASYAGVWHMSEPTWSGTQSDVLDSTGVHHGMALNGAATTVGMIGGGGTFGANSVNIDVGAAPSLLPGSITVEAWARPQSVGSAPNRHPYMVRQDYWRDAGLDPRGFYMEIYRTQTDPRPTFYTGNGSTYAHAFATTNVVNGSWYHVVGTRDAASGMTRIYVNGVEEGNATMIGDIAYLPNRVYLGGYDFETWNGELDEVRISNVARSSEWIRTEYENQRDPGTFVSLGALEPQ